MKKRSSLSGFTLLEIMIALTIMTIAFAAILSSESGSIHSSVRSRELNIAAWLARNLMVESEHLMEDKPFNELSKEESKNFPEPFQRFKWKREVRELKFPDFSLPEKEGGMPEPIRIFIKTITKFLNDSVRELIITVSWPRGKGEQQITVSTYLVDMDAKFNFSL